MTGSPVNADTIQVNEHLTIHSLVPPAAQQKWKLELFEVSEPISRHYHKVQRQIMFPVQGRLKVIESSGKETILQEGECICINPGIAHSLIPEGAVSFFALDFPGFIFPEDVFEDEPAAVDEWTPHDQEFFPSLDAKYFGLGTEKDGYRVYDLVTGDATEMKWSACLVEIHKCHKHFHRAERELFIVVNGRLDSEVDGARQILSIGETIAIPPGAVHQLNSASATHPVRVLCFSFPAFTPADMHYIND
ncbi:MAG TPA: cupin domain-containing protein [Rhabdochlamydiaceae bacterium]|jgi:quercetin dioxygenase-like cupin family protein